MTKLLCLEHPPKLHKSQYITAQFESRTFIFKIFDTYVVKLHRRDLLLVRNCGIHFWFCRRGIQKHSKLSIQVTHEMGHTQLQRCPS